MKEDTRIKAEKIASILEVVLGSDSFVKVSFDDPRIIAIRNDLIGARVKSHLVKNHNLVLTIQMEEEILGIQRYGGSKECSAKKEKQEESEEQGKPKAKRKPIDRSKHQIYVPKVCEKIEQVVLDVNPKNIMIYGPTGCGKTLLVTHLANKHGAELFRFQCRPDSDSRLFFGDKTVEVDEKTGQNFIKFIKGLVVKAMQHGIDDKGNETEKFGWLLLDEVGVLPAQVFVSLNSVLETFNARREIMIEETGERVKSHSKFRIFATANTQLRGQTSLAMAGYMAQAEAADASTIDRFGAWFRFGYSKQAEIHICMEKLGADKMVECLLKFRDGIRDGIKQNNLHTPFSTRDLVEICDHYRIYGNMADALYYSVFTRLPQEEVQKYNEMATMAFGLENGQSVLQQCEDNDMDYM